MRERTRFHSSTEVRASSTCDAGPLWRRVTPLAARAKRRATPIRLKVDVAPHGRPETWSRYDSGSSGVEQRDAADEPPPDGGSQLISVLGGRMGAPRRGWRSMVKETVRVLAGVACLWFATSDCYADKAFWSGPSAPAKAVRIKQALEWLDSFKRLDQQIPTLSPSEREWLEREYDNQVASGRFTARALAAMESPEYQKRVARERLDRILFALGVLVNARGLDTPTEVGAWVDLATGMMDPQLWQSVDALVRRKAVSPEINGVKEFYLENHVGWAQGILQRVVAPYFAGRLKE